MNENALVLDTLYDRIRGNSEDCFRTNVAGIELLKSPPDILSAIEEVLITIVEPALKEPSKQVGSKDAKLLGDYSFLLKRPIFPGLDYLLGAYLVIGSKADFRRAHSFLIARSDILLAKAVSVIPIFFRRMNGGYNFGASPKPEVEAFVKQLLTSHRDGVAIVAASVFEDLLGNG